MEKLLNALERKFGRFAIHNLAILLLAPQVAFYIWRMMNHEAAIRVFDQLALDPSLILEGEFWRLFSYILLPPPGITPIFFIFYVMLFHLYCSGLQSQWGSFRLNLYVLCNWVSVIIGTFIAHSLAPGVRYGGGATELSATLFLGFATYFPNYTFLLFLILPVKAKWFGWLTFGFYVYRFGLGDWDRPEDYAHRVVIVAALANYFLFFGPSLLRGQVRKQQSSSRRRAFEDAMRRGHEERERALREEEARDGADRDRDAHGDRDHEEDRR